MALVSPAELVWPTEGRLFAGLFSTEKSGTSAAIHKADLFLFEKLDMQAQLIGLATPRMGSIDHFINDGEAVAVKGVELGHHGEDVSFDSFLKKYNLRDPALTLMAEIVRAADSKPAAQASWSGPANRPSTARGECA